MQQIDISYCYLFSYSLTNVENLIQSYESELSDVSDFLEWN